MVIRPGSVRGERAAAVVGRLVWSRYAAGVVVVLGQCMTAVGRGGSRAIKYSMWCVFDPGKRLVDE